MNRLIFATNNAHKLHEAGEILGDSLQLVTLAECGITEDIPENEPTLQGNALAKARYVLVRTHADCFADDTGLEVEALDWQPGVRSARYAGEGHDNGANRAKLIGAMEGVENRRARFRTVVALIIDGQEHLFEGVVWGTIASAERGEGGFGYDSLFVPEGQERTFAQMNDEEKNAVSHRGRAMRAMAEWLKNNSAR